MSQISPAEVWILKYIHVNQMRKRMRKIHLLLNYLKCFNTKLWELKWESTFKYWIKWLKKKKKKTKLKWRSLQATKESVWVSEGFSKSLCKRWYRDRRVRRLFTPAFGLSLLHSWKQTSRTCTSSLLHVCQHDIFQLLYFYFSFIQPTAPDFTCKQTESHLSIRTRVQMSSHTYWNKGEHLRNQTLVPLKVAKQLWCTSALTQSDH